MLRLYIFRCAHIPSEEGRTTWIFRYSPRRHSSDIYSDVRFCFPNVYTASPRPLYYARTSDDRFNKRKKKVIDLIVIILYHDRCEFSVTRFPGVTGAKGTPHTHTQVRATDKNATGTDETILLLLLFFFTYHTTKTTIISTIEYRRRLLLTFTMLLCRAFGTRSTVGCVTFVRLRNESPREPSRRQTRPAMVIHCPLFVSRSSLPCLHVSAVFPVPRHTIDLRRRNRLHQPPRLPIILGRRIVIFRGFHRRADRLSAAHCSPPNIFPRVSLAKHHFFFSPLPARSQFC